MRYIDLATHLFARHGFHGVSLNMLAGQAGVSKQAVLHFFGSKSALYAAVLGQLARRLDSQLARHGSLTPQAQLSAYFSDLVAGAKGGLDEIANDATINHSVTMDAHLVVRALVDADPLAKTWPLKPYLDRLTALVQMAGCATDQNAARALVFQLIGLVQYLSISQSTLRGMYGTDADKPLWHALNQEIQLRLTPGSGPGPGPGPGAPSSAPTDGRARTGLEAKQSL